MTVLRTRTDATFEASDRSLLRQPRHAGRCVELADSHISPVEEKNSIDFHFNWRAHRRNTNGRSIFASSLLIFSSIIITSSSSPVMRFTFGPCSERNKPPRTRHSTAHQFLSTARRQSKYIIAGVQQTSRALLRRPHLFSFSFNFKIFLSEMCQEFSAILQRRT